MNEKSTHSDSTQNGFLLTPPRLAILGLLNILILIIASWGVNNYFLVASTATLPPSQRTIESPTLPATATSTTVPSAQEEPTPVGTPINTEEDEIFQGLIIFSIEDNGYTHLFAYRPESLPLLRLTTGEWDDIHPAISPDGKYVAFSSNREGQWDIYVLELATGEINQITNDLAFDGSPDWSPDGDWLVFETYIESNFDISIASVNDDTEPERITSNLEADFDPNWAPQGRIIAFTSNRSGANDIWTIDLDLVGSTRLQNLTRNPTKDQQNSRWSPDGDLIGWTSSSNGVTSIYSKSLNENSNLSYLGNGNSFSWSPDGSQILAITNLPGTQYYSIRSADTSKLILPPTELPGRIDGLTWGKNKLPSSLPLYILQNFSIIQNPPNTANQGSDTGAVSGRQFTIDLADVEAPYPQLNALVFERFYNLRDRVAAETGWDVLSSLENAFVPITNPLEPGREKDWLYTGRAFTLPPVLLDIGWMAVIREDNFGETYWRVYIRASIQDGSKGRPLYDFPWDFNARFTGNATYYEQGGAPAPRIPIGYWVDFTAIALDLEWERLPAAFNWRSLFYGARFNEFVITSGLDWEDAILQLYPREILSTPQPATR